MEVGSRSVSVNVGPTESNLSKKHCIIFLNIGTSTCFLWYIIVDEDDVGGGSATVDEVEIVVVGTAAVAAADATTRVLPASQ